jgi:hypothetical protein
MFIYLPIKIETIQLNIKPENGSKISTIIGRDINDNNDIIKPKKIKFLYDVIILI